MSRVTVGFSRTWNLWQVRYDDDRGSRIALETPDEREAERYASDLRAWTPPGSLDEIPPQRGLLATPKPRRLMQGDIE